MIPKLIKTGIRMIRVKIRLLIFLSDISVLLTLRARSM